MRWVSYRSADGSTRCGVVHDDTIHALGTDLLELLRAEGGLEAAAAREPTEIVELATAHLLAPIPVPPAVRNFAAFERHISNAGKAAVADGTVSPVWYEYPLFFFSNPAAIKGPHDEVPIAPGARWWDYEVEVAAVIAKDCSDLDAATAEKHIAGYLVYCDWSARDISASEMGFVYGPSKSKDASTSLGPFLVTPDELEPYRSNKGYALRMNGYVNGEHYGGGSWDEIHWSFGEMLAHASRGTTLRAGDILASGPVGTGCIQELSGHRPYLAPGDTVRVEVQELGAISARITAPEPS
ncbi:fumarylacetoacetate hydrolase family protein [Streptomyces achromogenes]|uniref:fumarylacetoacetate hydrolase family protein n=1 Tax=Streptomyces achromogenes TaxID=67255 RepID=UPI003718B5AD